MNPYLGDLVRAMAGFAGRVTPGRQRRTISILNDLPDHILKDIGIFTMGVVCTLWAAFVNIRGLRLYALLQRYFFWAGMVCLGIVMVTHFLADIIPKIDRVTLLAGGRIAGDGPKAELLTSDRLAQLFGVEVQLTVRDGHYHAW